MNDAGESVRLSSFSGANSNDFSLFATIAGESVFSGTFPHSDRRHWWISNRGWRISTNYTGKSGANADTSLLLSHDGHFDSKSLNGCQKPLYIYDSTNDQWMLAEMICSDTSPFYWNFWYSRIRVLFIRRWTGTLILIA